MELLPLSTVEMIRNQIQLTYATQLMPKFSILFGTFFSSIEQVHIQQQNKQINKDGDEIPKTEKHLSRQRLNFIWDGERKIDSEVV